MPPEEDPPVDRVYPDEPDLFPFLPEGPESVPAAAPEPPRPAGAARSKKAANTSPSRLRKGSHP